MTRIEISEALWLDNHREFTLAELAEHSGLPQDLLRQLIELEALPRHDATAATFGADCLDLARTSRRLHEDFDLDAGALALVMQLLARVHALEAELRALQARLPQQLL
jgi:chaperone modulatory protein CbpM